LSVFRVVAGVDARRRAPGTAVKESVHLWGNHVKNPGVAAGLVLAAKARLTFVSGRRAQRLRR
jgi:hypothetical protein